MVYITQNSKWSRTFCCDHTSSKIFVELTFCQNATLLNDTLSNVSLGQILCVFVCLLFFGVSFFFGGGGGGVVN